MMNKLNFDLIEHSNLIKEGREWLMDCYPDDEDEILECNNNEILNAVEREFDGGLTEFININPGR